jgi:hypothetical protein
MKPFQYKAGGALTEENADLYVQRAADAEVLSHLEAMNYVLLIEPRQQGKTSMINHLIDEPVFDNTWWGYVDVTTLDRTSEPAWYRSLGSRLLSQWSALTRSDFQPDMPGDVNGWRDFLSRFAARARDESRRLVIAFDEIGAITFPGATLFFSVLREIYNARKLERQFRSVTFILTGAFDPRDLIDDDRISPFNIAQHVRLVDFTSTQVRELVGKGGWSATQSAEIADRIHRWTGGQPYLCQWICSRLGSTAKSSDVDACVARLLAEEENHLPPIVKRLNSDKKMRDYVGRILAGEKIKFHPTLSQLHRHLQILGVVQADDEGFCTIRNRVYEAILSSGVLDNGVSISELPTHAGNARIRHLVQQQREYDQKYVELSRRIAALDTDIGRATEEFKRQPLTELKAQLEAERTEIANQLTEIERQLAGADLTPDT